MDNSQDYCLTVHETLNLFDITFLSCHVSLYVLIIIMTGLLHCITKRAEIWHTAAVCYSYTLLVGKPPFETSSLRETYLRISRNDYRVPSSLSAPARSLIHRLLHPDPQCRPNMEDVLHDEFLLSGM